MSLNKGGLRFGAFCAVLLVYFSSESILRQAVVSRFESDKIKPDVVLSRLPPSIRDRITYNIEVTRLRDSLARATDDKTKVNLLSSLALYTRDDAEKNQIFTSILRKYPKLSESVFAYTYFLRKDNSPNQVSIERYHEYVNGCDPKERLYIWQAGISKLQKEQHSIQSQIDFLKPLLTFNPDYKEYGTLYDGLSQLAYRLDQNNIAEKAKELKTICVDLPSLEMEQMKALGKETKKEENKDTKEVKKEEKKTNLGAAIMEAEKADKSEAVKKILESEDSKIESEESGKDGKSRSETDEEISPVKTVDKEVVPTAPESQEPSRAKAKKIKTQEDNEDEEAPFSMLEMDNADDPEVIGEE